MSASLQDHPRPPFDPRAWRAANASWLDGWLLMLRRLAKRRALFLRSRSSENLPGADDEQVISDREFDRLIAGEESAAETAFFASDPQAADLTREIAQRRAELEARREQMCAMGAPPAIETLARCFQLTGFEQDVLLLALAPDLDPALPRIFAYLQDDASSRFPTPRLALALFAQETDAQRTADESFLPGAPLRRFRLVRLGGGEPASSLLERPLRLMENLAARLQGIEHADEETGAVLAPAPALPITSEQSQLVERLSSLLMPRQAGQPWPIVNLTGPPGSGRLALAGALCERLRCRLLELDWAALPASGPECRDLIGLLERESLLQQAALYLDASRLDRPEGSDQQALRLLLESFGGLMLIASSERITARRRSLAVAVQRPDAAARYELWRKALRTPVPAEELRAVAEHFAFGPRAIVEVAGAIALRARHPAGGQVDAAREGIWQACREHSGTVLDKLAERLVPVCGWDDIVLPRDLAAQLREVAAQVRHRATVYETWRFGAKLSRGRGITALFSGPSGTGKTMAAEVLAAELGLDLYRIDLAGVVSKYIGETERNLKRVFDAAESSGAILFFDEADALFGRRTEIKDSHDRYANIEVDYLLQRMEDYRGLAILATNRRSALDRAFLRRLRFLIEFPLPDAALRRRIWRKAFPCEAPLAEIDWDALVRLEVAGGNIRNITLNAAFIAAEEGIPIATDLVMRAARAEYAKCDKAMTAAEFGRHAGRGAA